MANRQRILRWSVIWCCALVSPACAQQRSPLFIAATPSSLAAANPTTQRLFAEPKPHGANPYRPPVNRDVRLPVSISGFCIVSLRERQEWSRGSEMHQLVFDGKLYWFAGMRERAMFSATPLRYVPALSGDCVVSFAESGKRVRGDPRFGILHDQRLFFFRGQAEQKTFRASPEKYADGDLANQGYCLVSQADENKKLPGSPETTVIVEGLRYQFSGQNEQRRFLSNTANYGVVQPKPPAANHFAVLQGSGTKSLLSESSLVPQKPSANASLTPKVDKAETADLAMGGYCPVTIRENGNWVEGQPRFQLSVDGQTYHLAGKPQRDTFSTNPSIYLPALGGNCVVSKVDKDRHVQGSIYHAAQFEDRLFLFAGAAEKRAFGENPDKYVDADLAADGKCVVSDIDEATTTAGLPELLTWYRGKRYYFASPKHQDQFLRDSQRYEDR